MTHQYQHAVLPRQTHDERGREAFVGSMRRFVASDLFVGNCKIYEDRLKPRFEDAHGRPPASRQEVRDAIEQSGFYRMFGMLNRATQELLWETVGQSIERQLPELKERVLAVPKAGGTLRLDPTLDIPAYAKEVDIHVMPGGFHSELGPDDVFSGALYDRGVYLYSYGGLGEKNEGLGEATANFVHKRFPDFKPARILDLGCGAGMSTLPLAQVFPGAEIHAIDIAAPMLRYGHARSEDLGIPIHFSQENAVKTSFDDNSFDLVLSNLLFHETPQKVSREIVAESFRLLRPGGITVHNDMIGWPTDPFEEFMTAWNGANNNEPFERGSGTLDWAAACIAAGFVGDDVFIEPVEASYLSDQLSFVGFRGAVKR